jgi:L-aminopeptidase/D-esterase-like protein
MTPGRPLTLRDVPGINVGHTTDAVGMTGCTVVLAPGTAVAGVDVRGSAPGTRETDLLRPSALVDRVNAICLAGGSAFGLSAADGVMRYLAERGAGFITGVRPVPIVPAAIIFDLGVGSADAVPGPDAGYAACLDAEAGSGKLEGRLGAGTGATVGKLAGPDRASPGGVGSAAMQLVDGSNVGALAVNNAMGNVIGRDGSVLAGIRADDGGYLDATALMLAGAPRSGLAAPESGPESTPPPAGQNTVLAVVATDATLDRAQCRKLAELAHDGLALAITPVHTLLDGDVTFMLSTGQRPPPDGLPAMLRLGAAVVEVVRSALERSVGGSGSAPMEGEMEVEWS